MAGVEMDLTTDEGNARSETRLDPDPRTEWAMRQLRDLDLLVTERTTEILAVLQDSASVLKTEFTETMLKERRSRPPRERGSIGLRVRQATTSGPGIFQIEWYRVQGKQRTKYLKRGKDKDGRISQHYRLGAFGRLTNWEKDLILNYEPHFARLRTIQSHIGHIRLRFHLIDQALRQTGMSMHGADSRSDPPLEWKE